MYKNKSGGKTDVYCSDTLKQRKCLGDIHSGPSRPSPLLSSSLSPSSSLPLPPPRLPFFFPTPSLPYFFLPLPPLCVLSSPYPPSSPTPSNPFLPLPLLPCSVLPHPPLLLFLFPSNPTCDRGMGRGGETTLSDKSRIHSNQNKNNAITY